MCQQSHACTLAQNESIKPFPFFLTKQRKVSVGVLVVLLQVKLDLKTRWKSPTLPTFNSLLPRQPKKFPFLFLFFFFFLRGRGVGLVHISCKICPNSVDTRKLCTCDQIFFVCIFLILGSASWFLFNRAGTFIRNLFGN